MKKNILSSLKLCVGTIGLFSGAYALLVLGFAMAAAPDSREGSLILDRDGTVRGSSLIGQGFSKPEYFWPRPSAADYNAAGAAGSNLSPANPAIAERAASILARFELEEGQRIPADLVTASGAGLDPHITFTSANLQAERVATTRGLSLDSVKSLIDSSKDSPTLQMLGGEPLVNVLLLNLALDEAKK